MPGRMAASPSVTKRVARQKLKPTLCDHPSSRSHLMSRWHHPACLLLFPFPTPHVAANSIEMSPVLTQTTGTDLMGQGGTENIWPLPTVQSPVWVITLEDLLSPSPVTCPV